MCVFPMGMVPKKDDQGQFVGWRKIMHLSYPRKGDFGSVNSGIDPADTKVKYQSFDDAVALGISLGPQGYLAKTDLKSAFRQLPIHPEDLHLLGFRIDALWFLDVCMSFGLAIACQVFEKFSTALHWSVSTLIRDLLIHYLDDFLLGGGRNQQTCKANLNTFDRVCRELGVPVARDKTTPPTQVLSFLGLLLDMRRQVISIPANKVDKVLRQIQYALSIKVVRVKFLQSMVGQLNFVGKAIPGVRCFNRRFYSALILPKDRKIHPYYHVKVTPELREDLLVWKTELKELNCTVPFRFVVPGHIWDVQLYTDASSVGWGVWYQESRWAYGAWSCKLMTQDRVTLAEMLAVLIAMQLFMEEFQGEHVVIHVDNTNVVSWVNNQTSPVPEALHFIRKMVAMSIKHQVLVKARYIRSEDNIHADLLSRLQVSEFRWLDNPRPLVVPETSRVSTVIWPGLEDVLRC